MAHFACDGEFTVVDFDYHRVRSGGDEPGWLRRLVSLHGTPLLVVDADGLRQRYGRLRNALPGVALFYAVKALPDPAVVRILAGQGAGLDVASAAEIATACGAGVAADRIIHTHPVKKNADIRAALRAGVTTFVVDNVDELRKFRACRDRASVLVRLRFHSPDARVDLSRKFGCEPREAPRLLAHAAREGIRVAGFSFHVGSQCRDPRGHAAAVTSALELIASVRAAGFTGIDVLDIGGGFPADYGGAPVDIEAFCAPIREALSAAPRDLRLIAEPGRYLVADAVISVASVVGRAVRGGRPWYYLDDGVYGSYSGRLFDHAEYPLEVFRAGPRRPGVLAGPTCDSIDVIAEDIELPALRLGDLVVARSMGAYTAATATDFNGIPKATVVLTADDSPHAAEASVLPLVASTSLS